jgi:hypothetical protein
MVISEHLGRASVAIPGMDREVAATVADLILGENQRLAERRTNWCNPDLRPPWRSTPPGSTSTRWDHPDGWRLAWAVRLAAVLEQLLALEPSDGGQRRGRRGAPHREGSPLIRPNALRPPASASHPARLGQGGSRTPTASRPTGITQGHPRPAAVPGRSSTQDRPVLPRGFQASLLGESASR